ncbi:MAG: DVU_1555 family C-GCAxxG-C-C protein [Desulfitobacteriaceae bacterium]
MGIDGFRLFQLAAQGFCCSQILIILGLEAEGKDNPDLVRSMQGLCGGLGRSGGICGATTGGVCLLSLKAGKGKAEETGNPKLARMINDLLQWFDEEYESRDCSTIMGTNLDEGGTYPVKCGSIVTSTYAKVQEILAQELTETEE